MPQPIVNARRFILSLYVAAFLGLLVVFGIFFFQTYQEYAQFRRLEAESRERLARAEQRLREQERILQRLRTDPEYVEKVIRQQLRYAKPDELIFRFENLPPDSRSDVRSGIVTPGAR